PRRLTAGQQPGSWIGGRDEPRLLLRPSQWREPRKLTAVESVGGHDQSRSGRLCAPRTCPFQAMDVDVGTRRNREGAILDEVPSRGGIDQCSKRQEVEDLVRYHDESTGGADRARNRRQERTVEITQQGAESRPRLIPPEKTASLLHLCGEGSCAERDLLELGLVRAQGPDEEPVGQDHVLQQNRSLREPPLDPADAENRSRRLAPVQQLPRAHPLRDFERPVSSSPARLE